MSAWNADTAAGTSAPDAVTVVEGSSFCISTQSGDIHPGHAQGAFYQDTRILSRWLLTVNGMPLEPLTGRSLEPYRALFVGRPRRLDGVADGALVVEQERHVGPGLRNDIRVRNFSQRPVACRIEIGVDADLADLFEVKGGRTASFTDRNRHIRPEELQLEAVREGYRRGVVISASGAAMQENAVVFETEVPARGAWSARVVCTPLVEGVAPENPFTGAGGTVHHEAARRYAAWEEDVPRLSVTDRNVENVLTRSQADLGSLRIFDAEHPDRVAVAAGAPWFMALFGRDSLLSSYMALCVDPALATGTLQTLASLQGKKIDPDTEEEPGRIVHEVRLGASAGLAMGGGQAYYGTADATPLFVSLLAEVSRWGLAGDILDSLLPHADRALEWVEKFGDRDGDGFVEYARHNEHGLLNQGWKDSWDGINFADGRLAEPPIALCEVQAYVYSAYLGRAVLAAQLDDQEGAATWTRRAAELKEEFNERFWLPDRGYFAVALDKDKRPVDACASNMGHCLWLGIVDVEKAPRVVERLMSPEMFTGWGIRTLASDMGAYNPVSYHNGSVWPHDTTLIATGLMRYGFVEEAARVAQGLFAAAEHFGGRLPELFCGFSRQEYTEPVPYPTSCSPQAWAAASPVQLMRALLRFDPLLPRGQVHLAPILPAQFGTFRADHVRLATSHITVRAEGTAATIDGLAPGTVLRRDPRPRLEETLGPGYPHPPGH
ncbi:glycogen debranching N-terminal domain-containing protein [Kocuria sp.]|jgi:glycogen debranching enzyme|uniref:amylo-alpha-1,6-glucosidase n=1 Tax=Kocuria sp. TaxID=1871328 RepID=UPI0028123458|nr:glycogen debranching N-terminal domain-containing protein [Kocuria sp.]HST72396.1 glycogen debranching N-terminal domain-containing protein [Kocuria rosea]